MDNTAVMDIELEQEFAAIFGAADASLPFLERLKIQDPLTIIDDSLEYGTILIREIAWKLRGTSTTTERKRYMSEQTYHWVNWYEAVLSAELIEVDAPFGAAPLPPQGWLGHSTAGKVMLGLPVHGSAPCTAKGHFVCQSSRDDVEITYASGILNFG